MPEPVDPNLPPPVTPTPDPAPEPMPRSTSSGLPSNVAAALACIPLVGGIIFFILEKHDSFVRFYAMQSIILCGIYVLCWIVYSFLVAILAPIPAIGFVFWLLLTIIWALIRIAVLVLFIITLVKAFTNVRWEIPYIGPMARKQLGEI